MAEGALSHLIPAPITCLLSMGPPSSAGEDSYQEGHLVQELHLQLGKQILEKQGYLLKFERWRKPEGLRFG